jgi:hypothetical protein
VKNVRGENGQLEGLNSFLIPLNNSGVNWFNGQFANIPHRDCKSQSLTVRRLIQSFTSQNYHCPMTLNSVVMYDN